MMVFILLNSRMVTGSGPLFSLKVPPLVIRYGEHDRTSQKMR